MREYIVTLRNGTRYRVRADGVRVDPPYLALVLAAPQTVADPAPKGDVVALFDQKQVCVVTAVENLVSEERCDPAPRPHYVGSDDSDIPF